MEKEGVGMALPIAIVEDQTPDAQRLEELLQQQLPEAECTWFACGDDFLRTAAEPGLYAVVFLDFALLYPSAFLCLASLWEKLRTPRRTACIAAGCR